jgi:hypothetical protein
MFFGMALIVAGTAAGFYGLLPTARKLEPPGKTWEPYETS